MSMVKIDIDGGEIKNIVSRAMYEKLSEEDKAALLTAAFDRLFEQRERPRKYGGVDRVPSIFDEAFDAAISNIVKAEVDKFIETSDVQQKLQQRIHEVVLDLLKPDENGRSALDERTRRALADSIRGY